MAECKPSNFTGTNFTNACSYIMYSSNCVLDKGFINYYSWQYCAFDNRGVPSFLMFCWLIFLLLAIAVTADSFFAPCLVVVTKVFRMSQNLAGVTLLALGNGAPDIFSALSAIDSDNVGMALGSIFGAGILVNTITAGIIMIVTPFPVTRRPVMKDLIFYLLGISWCLVVVITRKIELWSALLFIVIYIIYVTLTVISRIIYAKYNAKVEPQSSKDQIDDKAENENNEYFNHFNNVLSLTKNDIDEIRHSNHEEIKPSFLDENYMSELKTARFTTIGANNAAQTFDQKGTYLSFRSSGRNITLKKLPSTVTREHGFLANIVMANEFELHHVKQDISRPVSMEENNKVIINNHGQRPFYILNEELPVDNQLQDFSNGTNKVEGYYVEFPGIIKHFFLSIFPLDIETWSEQSRWEKIQNVIQSPVVFILNLTIPVVEDDAFMRGWCKILNALHCIISPIIWILFFQVIKTPLGLERFHLIYLILVIGIILCTIVWFTSKPDEAPIYHNIYAFLGFITSIVWIYEIANEIVNLLTVFGVVFSIPATILGLSVLAFANSIGDLVSNIVLAKKGFPGIGYAACIGGPLFNLLVGIGLPFTIRTAKIGKIYVELKSETIVLIATALLVTVMNLIALPLQNFKLRPSYGIILIILYIIFFVMVILFSAGVIKVQI